MRLRALLLVAIAALACATPRPVRAQAPTRADSAAILLDAAQRLEAEGQRTASRAVLAFLVRNYADTPAAAEARGQLVALPSEGPGSGRMELVAWSTLYGAWLGIVVPTALGVKQAEVYGVGLVAGGPAGYALAQSLATSRRVTLGEARAMTFGFRWGSWQALGWVNEFTDALSTEAAFATLGIGGIGGMALGGALAHRHRLSAGEVAFAAQGYYWGVTYAAMLCALFDIDNHTSRYVLAGGDLGMVAAAAAAPEGITAGRAWLISATGIAGMLAGLGLELIVQADDEKVVLGMLMASSAAGLALGARSARAMAERDPESGGGNAAATLPGALLDVGASGLRVGVPLPTPTLVPVGERGFRRLYRPALSVPLFRAAF